MDATFFALTERLGRSLDSSRDEERWLADVGAQLQAYRAWLAQHVSASERDDGLFADLTATEPRVVPMVDRLRLDGRQLLSLADCALAALRRPDRSAREVRRVVGELVGLTRRYGARAAAAVHEALTVDIGVG
jgi:hypothetical protein